jgi:hypothetical protein
VTQIDGLERDRSVRWERPGVARGSTIVFDHPGCWRVNLTRGAEQPGDIWIDVARADVPPGSTLGRLAPMPTVTEGRSPSSI